MQRPSRQDTNDMNSKEARTLTPVMTYARLEFSTFSVVACAVFGHASHVVTVIAELGPDSR